MAATTSDPYHLNSGMRCIKYMILTISIMFAITSILLILVGTTIRTITADFQELISHEFLSPTELLINIGIILLLVSLFGCFGAFKESVALINIYGVLLFVIFIFEVATAIAAFCLPPRVGDMLQRNMLQSINLYEEYDYLKDAVDFMQRGLECCGINDPQDWCTRLQKNVDNNSTSECFLPESCYFEAYADSPQTILFMNGCFSRMNFIISQSTIIIATGATTVAFVQILGVICSFMLAKTLRRNKSLREARRWQFQQNLGILISGGKDVLPAPEGYQHLEKGERFDNRNENEQPIVYTANSPSVN